MSSKMILVAHPGELVNRRTGSTYLAGARIRGGHPKRLVAVMLRAVFILKLEQGLRNRISVNRI